ncbi:NlpC/P60 family protein [Undibacterium sp. RTI2.1]|uniref:NlpC/P60 family protein n=1 Tax=unclassified Undibacterium TaxID=2630295 RepID=UPI002AB42C81|nr:MULTISPECIES: NlpC/P60 family protein [unclassified Undibacterium]MDY7537682.1 NlpC/P60 family protein [Undibacterium sp. 5I1]MEB0029284.1 NlpC/P60 family protein [Undibacterium sp. RTI2.1]MEB0115592.1 NlpC/P60 family protein [Undibacterium sp. RTI2.2]MEB0256419.1 NlpC/P60 family protein [Undibacterium sp. 5I1]
MSDQINPKRAQIVAEAQTWLGTKYHHQGRVKGAGVDCAMLLIEVYHRLGLIPDIDPRPYPHDWHFHRDDERYLGWVKQYAKPVDVPMPGDVVLFQFMRCVSHGAIVVQWPQVIHSYVTEGVVLADASSGVLGKRVRGFYSLIDEGTL